MVEHPWAELQVLIREKWLTQKAFSSILWKKVSEVNELLKWKRNITIQRDYLLHQTLWTPMKYWILKQVDYDYSLIDVDEEPSVSSLDKGKLEEIWSHSGYNEESIDVNLTSWKTANISNGSPLLIGEGQGEASQNHDILNDSKKITETHPLVKGDTVKPSGFEPQETPTQKPNSKVDEDFKKRARIFKSF